MPIKLMTARQSDPGSHLVDAMHKSRALTFKYRLRWDVLVDSYGWEIDQFDSTVVNPLYLISVDEDEEDYRGSLRLLPTTGPNMLRDVFPYLLWDGHGFQTIESATIWESSRICGDCNMAFVELILGIAEVAERAGLTSIVSVFDQRILRLLKSLGCTIDILGTPRVIGGTMCYAGMFADRDQIATIRHRTGITSPVLSNPQELVNV